MTAPHPTYDPCAALPRSGTHILEASAGTGKTFAIKELVVRYIRETDTRLDQMLIMTFTRSAAGELRERIRSELRSRRDRASGADRDGLETAISQMDDASIGTVHEFCSSAFAGLGLRADADPGLQLTEDLQDLVLDGATDAYLADLQRYSVGGLDGSQALGIAKLVAANPSVRLLRDATDDTRIPYAERARSGIAEEVRREGLATYDDLVLRLRDALRHSTNGPRVAEVLQAQYRVVLIDEFQDTDPAQWEIVLRAFHGHAIVFLIGDPKQGIYAFRGADIQSYLDAAHHAETIATLGTNYRSDKAVVDGVLELLQVGEPRRGMALGDAEISVGAVTADITGPRLTWKAAESERRVHLRLITDDRKRTVGPRRRAAARDTAIDIARLLGSEPVLQASTPRRLAPKDIAVIVRTNKQAALVRDELRDAGLHAVINSTDSVFASRAAQTMLILLRAMERPRGNSVRHAVLAGLFDVDPVELATDEESAMAVAVARIHALNGIVRRDGIPALITTITSDRTILERNLSHDDGERYLTDLRHIGAILHVESRDRSRGMIGLADWLADQIGAASADDQERSRELTRRLESDADAVQVVTIHRCKGLQYPVAYVPFGWDLGRSTTKPQAVVFNDEHEGRLLDVRAPDADGRQESDAAAALEDAGEQLRMLYVALTRAASLLVMTHVDAIGSGTGPTRTAPLDRILFARSLGHTQPAQEYHGPLRVGSFQSIDVQRLTLEEALGSAAPERSDSEAGSPRPQELAAAAYDRTDIDTAWARASFTGLTKNEHRAPMEPVDEATGEKDDEPTNVPADEPANEPPAEPLPPGRTAPDPRLANRSPMADLPAGTAFGTLVHAVLEHADPAAADLESEVRLRCGEILAMRPMRNLTAEQLTAALTPVLRTPLGHLAPGTALADIAPTDRLPELDFELPLHQDRDTAKTVASIGALLADAADEPTWVRDYGTALQGAPFNWKQLRGYLTGSIDAVLRIDGRCYVVDYKTNRLGETLGDYHPKALPAAMAEANYPLQALLYSVALHRFLRLRMPGYDAEQHLGGILYLFVRGMAGPDTPVGGVGDPCGVFAWRPAALLVQDLSTVLGGEPA